MERLSPIPEKERVIQDFIENCPLKKEGVDLVVFSGSRNNYTVGKQSDIDITTVLSTEDMHHTGLDGDSIDTLLDLSLELRSWCDRIARKTNILPIVVATIRLEEAQIQFAQMLHPEKKVLPIHWLFHPSLEFMAMNEPPELAKGLLHGRPLKGNTDKALEKLEQVDKSIHVGLSGLDWLTDSLRILVSNFPGEARFIRFSPSTGMCGSWGDAGTMHSLDKQKERQPRAFLLKLASHNLHWFWKWNIIVPIARSLSGNDRVGWPDALNVVRSHPASKHLHQTFNAIHVLRHLGEKASLAKVVKLHAETFLGWPIPIEDWKALK